MSATSTSSLVRYLLFVSLAAAAVCGSSLIATDTKETDLKANTNETDLKADTNETDIEANTNEKDLKAIMTWSENKCGIERVTVSVKVEGCEETSTNVRACNGVCLSAVDTTIDPPFYIGSCTSCQPTRYKSNRPKLLKLICNGVKIWKPVYFPFIRECECVNTTSSLKNY